MPTIAARQRRDTRPLTDAEIASYRTSRDAASEGPYVVIDDGVSNADAPETASSSATTQRLTAIR